MLVDAQGATEQTRAASARTHRLLRLGHCVFYELMRLMSLDLNLLCIAMCGVLFAFITALLT